MATYDVFDAPLPGGTLRSAPLSFAQLRLWFLSRLIPRPAAYNVPGVYELHGDLDVAALRFGPAELTRRHEPLRTAIVEVAGQPEQRVHPADTVGVPLSVHDLTRDPQPRQRVREIAESQVRQPFDLGRPPLWRADLLRLGPVEHVLLMTVHHIVADGWSLPILLDELTRTYAAFVAGTPPALADLPVGYTDFAAWQRERLSGTRLDEHWRSALDGAPPVLTLPVARPRPAIATYRGDAVDFVVPDELRTAITGLCRRLRASPFILLLAAYVALLQRYTRQGDIVVGSPTAGRTHVEHEDLIGFFANTLPLRVDCTGDPSFSELVTRARAATLDALDHGELPFDRIVAAVDPVRDLSHHPIFQVLFAMTGLPADWAAPGLRIRSVPPFRGGTAKFELSLMFFEEGERLTGTAEFMTDLFDRDTVARLVSQLLTLTRAAVAAPGTPLSRLPLLEPAEQDAVRALGAGAGAPQRDDDVRRPVAGTRFHVLDADLRPVPVGVPGDLYVGGVEPGHPAERFVPDPFGPPGTRLFRTGELVRLRDDGAVEPVRATDRPPRENRVMPGQQAPRTATEAAMAGIWRAVLGVDEVGVHDDFFGLGGHSLLAMQILARSRAAFAVDLSLTTLFELPTVAGLCAAIEAGAGKETTPLRPRAPLEES